MKNAKRRVRINDKENTKGGKWMITTIKSGKVVEKTKHYVSANAKPRKKKSKASSARKQDENATLAVRTLGRLINCNMTHGDMWITLTYSAEGLKRIGVEGGEVTPERVDEIKSLADDALTKFLRRMRESFRKNDAEFKYIAVTSDMDGSTGELVRVHHHILMPRRDWELCRHHWRKYGTVDYRILKDQADYTPLAAYICKQCRLKPHERRWKGSRNLLKPEITETETHRAGELRPAPGAKVMEVGAYNDDTGSHYIRYVPKPRVKRGGHKETAIIDDGAGQFDARRERR